MDDPGYSSYQDSRLIPPDINEPDVTPSDCYEDCAHASACRMQLARLRGYDVDEDNTLYWLDHLARDLGCSEDCECLEA